MVERWWLSDENQEEGVDYLPLHTLHEVLHEVEAEVDWAREMGPLNPYDLRRPYDLPRLRRVLRARIDLPRDGTPVLPRYSQSTGGGEGETRYSLSPQGLLRLGAEASPATALPRESWARPRHVRVCRR